MSTKKLIVKDISIRSTKEICGHDYRNAIQIGKVDYQCPLCGKILNPLEWFLMNSFEFIDVEVEKPQNRLITNGNKRLPRIARNDKEEN